MWGGFTTQELELEVLLDRSANEMLLDLAGKTVEDLCMCSKGASAGGGGDGDGRSRAAGEAADSEGGSGGRLLGPLSDGARSCVVYLLNDTPLPLMLDACETRCRSRWPYPPPPKINPGAEVVLACEAVGGVLAAADGAVSYCWQHAPDSALVTIKVWWSSKVGGWMSYRCIASAGFRIERDYMGARPRLLHLRCCLLHALLGLCVSLPHPPMHPPSVSSFLWAAMCEADGNHWRHVRTRYTMMRDFHPLAPPMLRAASASPPPPPSTAASPCAAACTPHYRHLGLACPAGDGMPSVSGVGGDGAEQACRGAGGGAAYLEAPAAPCSAAGSAQLGVCVADVALDVRMGSRFHTTSERTLAKCSWLRSLVYALSHAPPATSTSSRGQPLQLQLAGAGGARAAAAA